jgi:putative CocE/NonD family hydrolase
MAKPVVHYGAGVTLERGVPCTMSDGVTLLADHYYPPGPAAGSPTLLMRQPYGRDIASTVVYAHPVFFARHGYNIVIQDVRGRGGSGGEFYPFRHEARDGAETIACLRTRPESNGRFGMYGFSYQGMTQWLAAAEQPEGLQCIAPAQTAHDLFRGWFYSGGALKLASSLGWGLQMLKEDARRRGLRAASSLLERAWANLPAQYLETPYAAHAALHAAGLPTYVHDWFAHSTPSEYWAEHDISEKMPQISVPALHLSGWYDTYLRGSVDGFLAARAHSTARDHQYLVAGPWQHIPWGDRIGPATLGPAANLDTDALHLRWFNHWLKDTGEWRSEPRIRHFALGENKWHSAEAFAAPTHTLFLHSNGRANSSKGDGTLTTEAPSSDEAPDLFVYDPEAPVAGPGGLTNSTGPHNQAAPQLGNNLLCYTTDPLTAPLRLFGMAAVTIYFAHSALSTDLVAKLCSVSPSNDSTFLTLGIARNQSSSPDQSAVWQLTLDPTSAVIPNGHRLRLEVASSAYPLFDRNPNNATPPRDADSWTWQRSTQSVFHDADHPSALHLPIAAEAQP